MTKVIVTTTINQITEAIEKFAWMKDWKLVVAGDKKTPKPYASGNANLIYLTPEIQEQIDPKLSDLIGWNCIQRRNFAFLFACKELKADIVYTCDDDNIPKDIWGRDVHVGKEMQCEEYGVHQPAFDPLSVTTRFDLWHRGYPLELVKIRTRPVCKTWFRKCDVQADLWDGEADVDAICRLTNNTSNCRFQMNLRPFTSNKPSPFNSQNTFLSREVMPHYFMFPWVGRMDDIWASYHVQAQGFRVMYGGPTVVQKRNEHNLVADLMQELMGIQENLGIVKEVPTNKNAVLDRLPERSLAAFRQYQTHFE